MRGSLHPDNEPLGAGSHLVRTLGDWPQGCPAGKVHPFLLKKVTVWASSPAEP